MSKEKKVVKRKTKKEDKYKNIKEYYKRLRKGNVYTYKQITEELEIRYYSGGNGKSKQLEVLSGLVEYEKIEEGYLIKSYKEKQVDIIDNRKDNGKVSVYGENYQLSLLGLLFLHRDSNFTTFNEKKKIYTVNLTKSYVFKELELVNEHNYNEARTKPNSYAQTIDVNIDTLWDNLDSIYDNCNANVKNNFKKLHDKKLITFEENIMIYKVNPKILLNEDKDPMLGLDGNIQYNKETEYRLATKTEVALIRSVKRDVLTEMNYNSEKDFYNNKKIRDEYYQKVEKLLVTKYNIEKMFKVYTVYFDDRTIINYLNKFGGEKEIEEFKRILGDTVIERSITSAKTRGTKAEKELKNNPSSINNKDIATRTNENYKEDSVKVCNSLRRNADLIKNSSLTEKRIIQENERVKNDRDSIEYFAKISKSKYDFILFLKEFGLLKEEYRETIESFEFY